MQRNLRYYRGLPYMRRARLCHEQDQFFWHAWIEELPGCEVDSSSKASAFAALDEVFEDYVLAKLEWGSVIPEPARWPHFNVLSRASAKGSSVEQTIIQSPKAPSGTKNELESREESDTTMVTV